MANPTNRRLLGTATTIADLEGQLQSQEEDMGMEVTAFGIVGSDSTDQTNFADVSSNLDVDLLAHLKVILVPAATSADQTLFEAFYLPIIQANTLIDSAMVLIDGNQQHLLLVRPGLPAGQPAQAQPQSGLTPKLPDYAQNLLSAAQGVPWAKSETLPAANGYNAVTQDTFRVFRKLQGPGGQLMDVIYYESKLAVDNDGSGPNDPFDPDHQDDTSLHDMQDRALNAHQVAFAVLPLDAAEAAKLHARHPKVELKRADLPDFQRQLGVHIGDIGVAFWREAKTGNVAQAFFIYGDKGPANFLGEGSVHMADLLTINSDPVKGGIGPQTMKTLGKGIIQIAFVGSGKGSVKSSLVPNQIDSTAQAYLQAFLKQPIVPGPVANAADQGSGV
jgi:Fungal chitosanase of glycosyl hydrolase group 75